MAPPQRRWVLLAVAGAAILLLAIGLLFLLIPVSRFGESPTFKIPEEPARASAENRRSRV